MNLGSQIKITNALNYIDANTSRNGATLDMLGYDGVLAIVKMAAINNSAVGDVHWEQDDDSAFGSGNDLAGTAIAVAGSDDDQIFVLELFKPTLRYVRIVMTKNSSNNQAESAVYVQYCGRKAPVSLAGADEYELHVSPAEGSK